MFNPRVTLLASRDATARRDESGAPAASRSIEVKAEELRQLDVAIHVQPSS